ncbi:MAG TPA: hypothetical protein EYP21_01045 [Syntrophaceae bacterium]|nr:hypothetical protein [Syntrophaceae bacterium]
MKDRRIKHGVYKLMKRLKRGELDGRSTPAKFLQEIRQLILDDLGGPSNLTNRQYILLDTILLPQLLFYRTMAEYAMTQGNKIIDEEGNLIGCLGHNFLAYGENIRRNLERLYQWGKNSDMDWRLKLAQAMQNIEGN